MGERDRAGQLQLLGPHLLRRRIWKVVMKAVFSFAVAWAFCGALAAFFSFGPALLRIVAFGPISLAQAVLA
jgi:hypothetical protein